MDFCTPSHALFLLAPLLSLAVAGAAGTAPPAVPVPQLGEMHLWPGPAPGVEEGTAGDEVLDAAGRVRNVSVPTLTGYLPEAGAANGTAIIMVSGGAYAQLAPQKYANLGTGAFLPHGIAVFNLKYRLQPPSKDVRANALADAKRAVRIVRLHAREWHIDPDKIGLIGASAGANLILNLMSHADDGQPAAADPIERQSCRPNFAGLLSTWAGGQKIDDFHFAKTTPVFLMHAEDDTTAPVAFARSVEDALKAGDVPVHAEYIAKGGHDAFGYMHGANGSWTERFVTWLGEIGK